MLKMITVGKRGELKKSQKGNAYFLITDTEGVNFVCFHSAQHPDFPEGAGVYSKITPREGSDATIELATEGEAEKPAKIKPIKPSVWVDDKNKSFALSYAKDLIVPFVQSGKLKEIDTDTPKKLATKTIEIAKIFNEWLMSSHEVAVKLQEEIDN